MKTSNLSIYSFIFLFVLFTNSCYEEIEPFKILSDTEYEVSRNSSNTFIIRTEGQNVIYSIIIDSDEFNLLNLPQKNLYTLDDELKTELHIEYFGKGSKTDIFEVKSVKSSFFSIEKVKSDNPTYKLEVYDNSKINVKRVKVLFVNEIHEKNIVINFK